MLRQDDDFGDAYEEGFRAAIEGTDIELVEVQEYNDRRQRGRRPQVTSAGRDQRRRVPQRGGAAALPDALTAVAESGWEPITWVSGTCISQDADGHRRRGRRRRHMRPQPKDPLNPEWDDDPAMVEYLETINEYQPADFDPENAIVGYGYTQAAIFVEALKAAEAPTRLAVMESMRNLDGISDVGLLLPGVSVTTSADDSFMGESVQLAQYESTGPEARNHFVPTGELIDLEGQTADVSPEELVNS